MRKLFFSFLFITIFSGLQAQKLKDVQKDISNNNFTEAKVKIDQMMTDPRNQSDASAWYYKGKIYSSLAQQDSTNSLDYDAPGIAFEAFKKYQEMDAKNTLMILEQNVGLFQLYDLYYNRGVKNYNDKDYAAAFEKMKKALEVEDYIRSKDFSFGNFSFPALDTQLVNLTASSAYLAKKESEAIPYFEKIADARVGGKEYKEVYALLVDYYVRNNNNEKADKYLNIGRDLYPDNDYWVSVEFGSPGDDIEARFKRYEAMLKKYPENYTLAMDYAIELFNYTYSYDSKPADYDARVAKTGEALERALKANSTSTANFVMSQHVYNQIYDIEDALRAIRGTTAADKAKRKPLVDKLDQKYEELFRYTQKAYDLMTPEYAEMKPQDKANYRKVINILIDYHTRKKQTDKVTLYQERLKAL